MSSETDQLNASTGEVGIPVDAVCTGCRSGIDERRVRIKRASIEELVVDDLENAEGRTFRHVCHHCQGPEYWNGVAVLHGLIETDRGESE